MSLLATRRQFLASTAVLAGGLVLPRPVFAEAAPTRLTVTRRTLEVNGRAAPVFGIVQSDGRPGIAVGPGERFRVDLANASGEETIVHWHGQTPPPAEDGVTDTGYAAPIADGASQVYDFAARTGTHWMHSHHGLQEQLLLAAPLVVRTPEDAAADVQEVVVMLHDFSFRPPEEILAALGGAMAHGAAGDAPAGGMAGMDHGSMGGMPGMDHGSMPMGQASGAGGMDHAAMGHGAMGHDAMPMAQGGGQSAQMPGMAGMDHGGAHGGAAGGADLNDVEYDAYLANDRTLADPEVISVERGGRVRLRLINGATSTAFWIELGGLFGSLVAVDGNPVKPVTLNRLPLATAQRVDLLITLPEAGAFPILAQREGDRARTGIVLATPGAKVGKVSGTANAAVGAVDLSLEAGLAALRPLTERPADVTRRVVLGGGMMPYVWTMDGRTFTDRIPIAVKAGQRVVVDLVNESMMAHPMHLHGHHFQVVGIDGSTMQGAVRDTVLVPARGTVTVAFDADNPGRWLFHCHNLYHMATGMMTELVYAGA